MELRVDKTLLIKDILDKKASVNLFTRPRRFGRTLALSMLKYYFEAAYDRCGNKQDFSEFFADMKIAQTEEKYQKHQGQYPEMKNWYNGYLFGETNAYNPWRWSCIKYLKDYIGIGVF